MNLRFTDDTEWLRDRAVAECMIQPLGLLHGRQARDGVAAGLAAWLAGGPQAFTAVEIIDGQPGKAARSVRLVRDMAAIRDPLIRTRYEQLCETRSPMAGLSWGRPRIVAMLKAAGNQEASQLGRKASSIVTHGLQLAHTGADIIAVTDDGGLDEEPACAQVAKVITDLNHAGLRLGVMSSRATVIRTGLAAGARIVFDTGALADEEVLYSLSDSQAPLVIRHQGNTGHNTGKLPPEDFAMAVHLELENRIEICEGAGISRRRIIVDPGLGVGKSAPQSLALLNDLGLLHGLGCPILIGAGCKDVVGDDLKKTGNSGNQIAGNDSAVVVASAFSHGAQLVFAHEDTGAGTHGVDRVERTWSVIAAYHSALSGRREPQ